MFNTTIYQNAVNKIGEKKYSFKIIWGEDLITSFALFREANSFKFIGKYGIFRYKNKKTASNNTPFHLYALSFVVYLDVIFDFTNNTIEDKKYVIYIALKYFKSINVIQILTEEERNFLNSILLKIFKCNYISVNDKNRVKNIFEKYKKLNINTDIDYKI